MNYVRYVFAATFFVAGLSACTNTHKDLKAPCPEFGRYCTQTPVNATNDTPITL